MESPGKSRREKEKKKKKKKKKKDPDHPLPLIGVDPSSNLLPSRHEFFQVLAVAAIAVIVAFSCNIATKNFILHRRKPLCDNGEMSGFCEPCPTNAVCSEGKWQCVHGYRKHGRSCIEDGEINQAARKLSDWILLRICRSHAQFMCTGAGKAWFKEEEILNTMDGYKFPDLDSDSNSHMLVKTKAMESLLVVLETRKGYDGTKEVKCPYALAEKHKSIYCLGHEWIDKHILFLVAAIPMIIALIRICWGIHQKRKLSTRAEQLYIQVCEVLEEAALMAKDTGTEGESWVVASRLRDHLLSPKERKNSALWKKVEALVQEDSRLEQYQKLIKGEPKIIWEWQVEGSLRSSKVMGKSSKMKAGEQIVQSSQNVRRKLQLCESDS